MADGASFGGFVKRLKGIIEGHASLERVAGDPALMAELLLLVRMSFADRKVEPQEAEALRAIATKALGLDAEDLGEIMHFIDEFGYETTDAQAAAMLKDLPEARRREIMDHLATMARADGEVSAQERALFHATARRLGLE